MEMYAFCCFDFLQQLTSPYTMAELGDEHKAINFLNLRDLVFNNANIIVDVPKVKIEEHIENPYIRQLIKNNKIGCCPEKFTSLRCNPTQHFKSEPPRTAVYLMSNLYGNDSLHKMESQSGYYFLNPKSAPRLFTDYVQDLEARSQTTWRFLADALNPHHSMVIADPYIFKSAAVESCLTFIEEVAPRKLDQAYYLSLIGSSDRRNLSISKAEIIRSVDAIKRKLNRIIPQSCVEFHIVNNEEFHDRLLITNNSMTYSGSGLDAVGKNGMPKKDSYWVAVNAFKRLVHNGSEASYGHKMIKQKLRRIKSWIGKDGTPILNPLFNFKD